MKLPLTLCRLALAASLALVFRPSADAAPARPPNIIFIVADDLGYGDIGAFGQKFIRTPNLDRLAAEGMRLTQHYSGNAVCAPSRCVLMTGWHPGHAFIRDNREMKPEGQYPIPADTVTLPKLLRAQGYVTGGFGKWGLGGPGTAGEPLQQGFDRWFGYNCQAVAHNFYPTHLWDNERHFELGNAKFSAHQKLPPAASLNDPESYAPYVGKEYSADLIAAQARAFVRANQDRPFFCYIPTTVPHLALQVPEDSLAEYRGRFDDQPYDGSRGYLPHQYPRAAYAAMVTRMDREIGRLMDLVKELGLDGNTLFIFSSDNGPLYNRLGGTDCEFFNSHGGLRGRKGSLYEGGFRVPTLVRWAGRIKGGTTSDYVRGFEDWIPTLLELIGAKAATPAGLDGVSLAPILLGRKQDPRPFLYREFPGYGGQQALRVGDWKAVRQNLRPRPPATPTIKTELYHLAVDPTEQNDVAAQQPELVARMEKLLREQHTPSKEFPLPALDR
jgi:arylsulfatase A-like enzyme